MTTPSLMRIAGFRRLSRVVSHAAASSSSSSPPPPSSRRVAPPSHLAPRATQRHHHHRHHLAAAAGPPGHRRRRHGGARATADADPGVANPGLDAANLRIRGVSVEGDDVRAVLANAGLSPTQVDAGDDVASRPRDVRPRARGRPARELPAVPSRQRPPRRGVRRGRDRASAAFAGAALPPRARVRGLRGGEQAVVRAPRHAARVERRGR